jgi:hypothetical protein
MESGSALFWRWQAEGRRGPPTRGILRQVSARNVNCLLIWRRRASERASALRERRRARGMQLMVLMSPSGIKRYKVLYLNTHARSRE